MYFKADIRDERLLQTVCDIMDIYAPMHDGNTEFPVFICDEYSAAEYAGRGLCVVLYRDEKFTGSAEYEKICGMGDVTSLKVPFMIEELVSAVSIRRAKLPKQSSVDRAPAESGQGGNTVDIDYKTRRLSCRGCEVTLTAREFALFDYMHKRAGKVVSRAELMRGVWNCDTDSNVVDVYMSYLRRKLDVILPPGTLSSVRGFGYVLKL